MEQATNRSWGTPPWRSDPAFTVSSHGAESSSPEVAIIGGGFTGLSAAYHLARRGVSVTVLEADSFGGGASGRTGGLVLEGTAAGIRPGADDCVPFLDRLAREHQIDCGLELPGCWEIAHEGKPETQLPWRDDGRMIHVASTLPGGVVNPLALVHGLARIAGASGAELFENARVLKLATTPLRLELDRAIVKPKTVIVATNAWIGALIPGLRVGIKSCLTFALATEPLSDETRRAIGLANGHPFFTIDQPYLWGRTLYDGGLLIGGGLLYGSPAELEQIGANNSEVRAVFDRVERRIHALNPALASVKIAARWGGPIAITSDYFPLISQLPEHPEIYAAGGYTGHGVAMGVKAGSLIADAIVDGKP
ncbi:MAG: FAD-binding oxidoreductase, partial [Candidatus Binataceae bacterium]